MAIASYSCLYMASVGMSDIDCKAKILLIIIIIACHYYC